jgi:hypothetical protein
MSARHLTSDILGYANDLGAREYRDASVKMQKGPKHCDAIGLGREKALELLFGPVR